MFTFVRYVSASYCMTAIHAPKLSHYSGLLFHMNFPILTAHQHTVKTQDHRGKCLMALHI